MRPGPPPYKITSVDHALRLIHLLNTEGEIGVTEAAERLGVARSTAHRLMAMLVYRDFAEHSDSRRYRPGPALATGAKTPEQTALVRGISLRHLELLQREVNESVHMMVLAGDQVRFIASLESTQALRVTSREGSVFPAHLTSGGKALLAEMDDQDVREMYEPAAVEMRDGDPPDLDALLRESRIIRRHGFALNHNLSEQGVTAVGRVVHLPDGKPVAAVSVSMPAARFTREILPRVVSRMGNCVTHIERDLRAAVTPAAVD